MQNTLRQELMEYWTGTLACNLCKLPRQFTPQFRPVGTGYKPGGVAFIQINPGVMGSKTESQIQDDYILKANRDKARLKNSATKDLRWIEKEFLKSPSSENWNNLCSEYFIVMRKVWGWPPGRYANTIESHGVSLENVAVINLA